MGRKRIRLIDIATACAVLGIFASLAIPSYLQMQARGRVDRLIESARSCGQELSGWISSSAATDLTDSGAGDEADIEAGNARGILEAYARMYNKRVKGAGVSSAGALLVVEPAGTQPPFCERDGKIHLIPLLDASPEGVGAKGVVTDENKIGGPHNDGILAVFEAKPGTE